MSVTWHKLPKTAQTKTATLCAFFFSRFSCGLSFSGGKLLPFSFFCGKPPDSRVKRARLTSPRPPPSSLSRPAGRCFAPLAVLLLHFPTPLLYSRLVLQQHSSEFIGFQSREGKTWQQLGAKSQHRGVIGTKVKYRPIDHACICSCEKFSHGFARARS